MDLNFDLHPAQLDIFNADTRFKVVAAGRRFGKSRLAAVELIIEAAKSVNEYGYDLHDARVFYVAPTFDQGKRIMWGVLKELGQDIIKRTVENQAIIELINGRIIEIKGADRPDTLRGVKLSYCVLDEYAWMKPSVWEMVIRPALADVKGGAMFIGTPEGKNHFYKLFKDALKAPDEWTRFQFNSLDNPFLDPKEVEQARNEMSAAAFRQEFEASFEASGGGVFMEEHLHFDSREPEGGQYFIAVDPAGYEDVAKTVNSKNKDLDDTAIAVVKVGDYGWWVREIDSGRWGVRETALKILRHAQQVKASIVGIEEGALKNAIMPYLEDNMQRIGVYPRIEPCKHGGRKKTDRIAWALQGRFQHGRIILNEGHWKHKFIEQYLDFPNPLSHDDLLDALAYIDQVSVVNYNEELELDEWEPIDDIAGL